MGLLDGIPLRHLLLTGGLSPSAAELQYYHSIFKRLSGLFDTLCTTKHTKIQNNSGKSFRYKPAAFRAPQFYWVRAELPGTKLSQRPVGSDFLHKSEE